MTKNNDSELIKLKNELAKIKLEIKAGKNKNTNAHKKTKKQIARLLTIKKEKQ